MKFNFFHLAAWRAPSGVKVRRSGVWQVVTSIRIWKLLGTPPVGVWKQIYVVGAPPPSPPPSPPPPPPPPPVALTVTANPTSVSGTRVGQGVVYTNIVVVTASKGVAPYKYVFSLISFSGSITPKIVQGAAPYTNQAQFTRDMEGVVPEQQTARFKCKVTDANRNVGSCYIDATWLTAEQSGTGGGGVGPGNGTGQPPVVIV